MEYYLDKVIFLQLGPHFNPLKRLLLNNCQFDGAGNQVEILVLLICFCQSPKSSGLTSD